MGLLIFAPILVLTMLHLVFNGDDYDPKVGLVNVPETLLDKIELNDATVKEYDSEKDANEDLSNQKIDGYLRFDNQTPSIFLEGSDPSVNGATVKWIQTALKLIIYTVPMKWDSLIILAPCFLAFLFSSLCFLLPEYLF
jgi:ABC-2 type transport system permease protein